MAELGVLTSPEEDVSASPEIQNENSNSLSFQDVTHIVYGAFLESGVAGSFSESDVNTVSHAVMDAFDHTSGSEDGAMAPLHVLEDTILSVVSNISAQDSASFTDATANVQLANDLLSLVLQGASGSISNLGAMMGPYGSKTPEQREAERRKAAAATQQTMNAINQMLTTTAQKSIEALWNKHGGDFAGIHAELSGLKNWEDLRSFFIENGMEDQINVVIELARQKQEENPNLTRQEALDAAAVEIIEAQLEALESRIKDNVNNLIGECPNSSGEEILTDLVVSLLDKDSRSAFEAQRDSYLELRNELAEHVEMLENMVEKDPDNPEWQRLLERTQNAYEQQDALLGLYISTAKEINQAQAAGMDENDIIEYVLDNPNIHRLYTAAGLGTITKDVREGVTEAIQAARAIREAATATQTEVKTSLSAIGVILQQMESQDGSLTKDKIEKLIEDVGDNIGELKECLVTAGDSLALQRDALQEQIDQVIHFANIEGIDVSETIDILRQELERTTESIQVNDTALQFIDSFEEFMEDTDTLDRIGCATNIGEIMNIIFHDEDLRNMMTESMANVPEEQRRQVFIEAASTLGIDQETAELYFQEQTEVLMCEVQFSSAELSMENLQGALDEPADTPDEAFIVAQRAALEKLETQIANLEQSLDMSRGSSYETYYTDRISDLEEKVETIKTRLDRYEEALEESQTATDEATIAAAQAEMVAIEVETILDENGEGGDESAVVDGDAEAPEPTINEAELMVQELKGEIAALFTGNPSGLSYEAAKAAIISMDVPEAKADEVLAAAEKNMPEVNIVDNSITAEQKVAYAPIMQMTMGAV